MAQVNLAFRLHWSSAQSSLEQVLIARYVDVDDPVDKVPGRLLAK